ncbi:hypothetical protein HO913_00240 [Streptococcus suis]|nr:hypothetical protein [Streptococcus suis]HEL1820003.1 hypothetical protein [Streptococcus suis]HEM6035467.1 hypothetical protein [Streptococcus suis]HEM6052605.1 hypothetical protein [Streptococcus suis]HEM6390544.1 hypothetical protein [Streptococcus suis]
MRFRKKPVVIEAVKLENNKQSIINAIEFVYNVGMETSVLGMDFEINKVRSDGGLIINTLEGNMLASFGDYIIKGVQGEFYPCKPGVFAETYELVED